VKWLFVSLKLGEVKGVDSVDVLFWGGVDGVIGVRWGRDVWF